MEPVPETFTLNICHRIQTQHKDLIETYCNLNKINSGQTEVYSKCTYRFKKYNAGYFISQHVDVLSPENVFIFEIKEILSIEGSLKLYLIYKRTKIIKFENHFVAYVVDISNNSETDEYNILQIDNLAGPPVNVHKTARGYNMIRPNQYC